MGALLINKFKIGTKVFADHTARNISPSAISHRMIILDHEWDNKREEVIYKVRFESGPWSDIDRINIQEKYLIADDVYIGPRTHPEDAPEPKVTRSMLELYLK